MATNEGRRLIAEGILSQLDGATLTLFAQSGGDIPGRSHLDRVRWSWAFDGDEIVFRHEELIWTFDGSRPDVYGWRVSRGSVLFAERFPEPLRVRQKGDEIRITPVFRAKITCEE